MFLTPQNTQIIYYTIKNQNSQLFLQTIKYKSLKHSQLSILNQNYKGKVIKIARTELEDCTGKPSYAGHIQEQLPTSADGAVPFLKALVVPLPLGSIVHWGFFVTKSRFNITSPRPKNCSTPDTGRGLTNVGSTYPLALYCL